MPRRFRPQEPAADHHGTAMRRRRVNHGVHVPDVAEGADARQIQPGDRRDDGLGTGGEQQPLIRGNDTSLRRDGARDRIDRQNGVARMQHDVVLVVPGAGVDLDLRNGLLAGQYRGKQNAIVIHMRFGAEHGDIVTCGVELQQLFHRAHSGHAVADDNKALAGKFTR